jgi:hypothetical protein
MAPEHDVGGLLRRRRLRRLTSLTAIDAHPMNPMLARRLHLDVERSPWKKSRSWSPCPESRSRRPDRPPWTGQGARRLQQHQRDGAPTGPPVGYRRAGEGRRQGLEDTTTCCPAIGAASTPTRTTGVPTARCGHGLRSSPIRRQQPSSRPSRNAGIRSRPTSGAWSITARAAGSLGADERECGRVDGTIGGVEEGRCRCHAGPVVGRVELGELAGKGQQRNGVAEELVPVRPLGEEGR